MVGPDTSQILGRRLASALTVLFALALLGAALAGRRGERDAANAPIPDAESWCV